MSSLSKFTRAGVRDYEKRRYRGLDQKIVHSREMKIIGKMIDQVVCDDQVGEAPRVVCDAQAGEVDRIVRASGARGLARPGSGRLALDLPCGYGRFTPMLRERGFDVVSADLSVEMARRAAENAAEFPKSPAGPVRREQSETGSWFPSLAANAGQLPFPSGIFDLVFSIRFFHHVHTPEDRAAILREFHRVSAGYAVVSFYRANTLHAFQRRLRRLFGKSRTNIKMVEPGVFEKAAAEAGFEIVRITPLFGGLHAYHLALLKATRV
jgi:SAM-dependent methyltransferase